MEDRLAGLFSPFQHGSLKLPNRFVMAPMTRQHSPAGVPTAGVVEYYRRRAAGGVGLIISEGASIPHPASVWSDRIPHLWGHEAAEGWDDVLTKVHSEGAQMYAQMWHQGAERSELPRSFNPDVESVSPSGIGLDGNPQGRTLTLDEVEEVVASYVAAATFAQDVGFDGVELHGAHGYLLDQFMWNRTNQRTDEFRDASAFPTRTVRAVRAAVGPDFPIVYRFSQWKTRHYSARLAETPEELADILCPLVEAGADILHLSTRRFWEPAFPERDERRTLAGWARALTGTPTVAVGSVGLDRVFMDAQNRSGRVSAGATNLDRLVDLFDLGDFDLVAVGRALLSEPEWVNKHRAGLQVAITPYKPMYREELM